MNDLVLVFRKTFDFYGRSRRREFWTFAFFIGSILFMLTFFYYFFSEGLLSHVFEVANTVFGLLILLPTVSLVIRRLHDTGRSGWWGLSIFVPVIGQLAFLVFMMQDSQIGYNDYGEYPKFDYSY